MQAAAAVNYQLCMHEDRFIVVYGSYLVGVYSYLLPTELQLSNSLFCLILLCHD